MARSPEATLTPSEMEAYNFHKRNLLTKMYQKNGDGSITTFMGAVVDTPDGGAQIIPTYWHGSVRDVPDAMRKVIQSGIKFPTYHSVDEALKREKVIHQFMARDIDALEGGN